MKLKNLLAAASMVAVAISLPSCGSGDLQLATVDFVALDGHTAYNASREEFTIPGLKEDEKLSSCINGMFTTKSSHGYSSSSTNLYSYRDGKAALLDSGFVAVGFYNCDRIPTTKPDSPIVILDGEAKPVFTAEAVDGVPVKRVAQMYSEDLLWFELEDKTAGFFDKDGNVKFRFPEGTDFSPLYEHVVDFLFRSGFVFVHVKDGYATYNKDGEMLHLFAGKDYQRLCDEIVTTEKFDGGSVTKYFDAKGGELRSEESPEIKSESYENLTDDEWRKTCEEFMYPFDLHQYILSAEKENRGSVFIMLLREFGDLRTIRSEAI